MAEFIVVGIGGFIGSCMRFGLTKLSNTFCITFPYGTLLSNVIAALCIGFIIGFGQQSASIAPKVKLFLTTGLLGGLSTFSTFSLETVNLFKANKPLIASGNILLNLVNYKYGGMAFVLNYVWMEIAVIVIEAVIYRQYLNRYSKKAIIRKWMPAVYAVIANIVSFCLGFYIALAMPGIF